MILIKCIRCNVAEFEKKNNRKYCDECNLEKRRERCRNYKANNREKIQAYNKEYKEKNKEYLKFCTKIWSDKNRDIINEKQNKYASERRKTDVSFKLACNFRSKLYKILNGTSSKSLSKLLGFDCDILKKWLEFQFDSNMNFENHGEYWHLDHVIPCAKFDLDNIKHLEVCVHWTNIQPLKASINSSKKDTISLREIHLHEIKIAAFIKMRKDLFKDKIKINRYENYLMVINNH
jgi:hypothetical protein